MYKIQSRKHKLQRHSNGTVSRARAVSSGERERVSKIKNEGIYGDVTPSVRWLIHNRNYVE